MSAVDSSRSAGIKRTGDLMLTGWKMLATICPICNFALLSKGGHTQCAMCNMPVLTEEEYNKKTTSTGDRVEVPPVEQSEIANNAVQSDASITSTAADIKIRELSQNFESLEEAKKEYDRNNKKKDSVSAKLGDRMLSGWALLGSVCPKASCSGTPLMRKGATRPMVCVSCDKEFVVSEYDGALEEASANKQAASTKQPSIVAVAAAKAKQSSSVEAAHREAAIEGVAAKKGGVTASQEAIAVT
jgi:uncharacterized Zn finger protein (UPF0148 family)